MANIITGRKLKIYLGKETTFGTKASSFVGFPITSFSGGIKKEYITSETKVNSRAKTGSFIGSIIGEGSIDAEIYPDTVGYILKGILGSETVALVSGATSTYEHTFTFNNDDIPSWTIQINYGDVKVYNFLGTKFDELTISAAPKEFIKMSGNLAFRDEEEEGSPESGSINPTLNPLLTKQIKLKIDGTDFGEAKSISLSIKNAINKDDYRLNQSDKITSLSPTTLEVSGSMEVLFNSASTTLRDKFLNGTPITLELIATSDEEVESGFNYSLTIKLNEVYIKDSPIDPADDGMKLTCEFEAFIPDSGELIEVDLVNGKSDEH